MSRPTARQAILKGDLDAVRCHLLKNPNHGPWVLHHAAQYGRPAVVELALEIGCRDGLERALADAASPHATIPTTEGHVRVVDLLLSAGADPTAQGVWSFGCPLVSAAAGGFREIVELLLAHGARWNVFTASALGEAEAVSRYVEEDPTLVRATDRGGLKPIHCCAASGMGKADDVAAAGLCETADLLLKHGAGVEDLDASSEWGHWSPGTPLAWAACDGNEAVARLLIEQGADVDGTQPQPVLEHAVHHCPSIAEMLVERGADVNRKRSDSATVLHLMAHLAHVREVKWLLTHNADPNARMDDGRTPLHRAAERNSGPAVCKLLLQAGAEINARDANGETPLATALRKKKTRVAECLRSHGGIE
ncbi:MAG: ankyrin repeat domain-containing protein [Armatimonadetes bacterium]|nr:ankyrin repeat domain-containing protein [Armatimonadota bacterium]